MANSNHDRSRLLNAVQEAFFVSVKRSAFVGRDAAEAARSDR